MQREISTGESVAELLRTAGKWYRIFTPSESTRINIASDCNRSRSVANTEGRGSFARNESRSRERSAFNRIKHVSFLRPSRMTKYRCEYDVDARCATVKCREGFVTSIKFERFYDLKNFSTLHYSILIRLHPAITLRDTNDPKRSLNIVLYARNSK